MGGRRSALPFGLRGWSDAPGGAIGVVLELPAGRSTTDLDDPALVAAQLPDPASLEPGQLVFVLPRAASASSWLGRLRGAGPPASVASRATALLARGFAGIGAGTDPDSGMDLVWGIA